MAVLGTTKSCSKFAGSCWNSVLQVQRSSSYIKRDIYASLLKNQTQKSSQGVENRAQYTDYLYLAKENPKAFKITK